MMLFENLNLKQTTPGSGQLVARFWMVIASIIIGINLFLILTLLQMAPKLKVIAQILSTAPMRSEQLLQTEPFSSDTGDKSLIDEALLRFYLENRYSSFQDKREMEYRWGRFGPVARLSSPSIYSSFSKGLKEKINTVMAGNTTRSIDILSVSRLDNIFTVEFDLYTYGRGQVGKKRRVAVIEIAYSNRGSFGSLYSNPYGMYVKSFKETKKSD